LWVIFANLTQGGSGFETPAIRRTREDRKKGYERTEKKVMRRKNNERKERWDFGEK
jgi:hypothetical protein